MTNLDYYLTCDHVARRNTTLISIVAGSCVGTLLEASGATFKIAAISCILVIAAVEMTRARLYTKPFEKKSRALDLSSPTRRSLLLVPVAAALFVFFALIPTPRIEAAVLERRLRELTGEDPLPFEKMDALINLAIQNNIPISEKTIAAAKHQVLRVAAKESSHGNVTSPDAAPNAASATLGNLESYTVHEVAAVSLRLSNVVVLAAGAYALHAPVNVKRSSSQVGESREGVVLDVEFSINVPPFNQMKTIPAVIRYLSPKMESDVLIARQTATGRSLTLSDAPEFVHNAAENQSHSLVVLQVTISSLRQTLDSLIWIDVLFDRCFITYQGGTIQLDGVTFLACEFSPPSSEAEAKVLDYIKSQEGKPVTLKRS